MDAVCTLMGGAMLLTTAAQIADTSMRSIFLACTFGVIVCNFWLVLLVTGASHSLGLNDKVFVFSDKMVNNVVVAILSNSVNTYAACVCPKGNVEPKKYSNFPLFLR